MKIDIGELALEPAYMPEEKIETEVNLLQEFEFKTNFSFLEAHRGFRRGEFHTFTGSKGAGKSTLCRSLICEIMNENKNTLIYLSEETRNKYMLDVNVLFMRKQIHEALNNLIVLSEFDLKKESAEYFISIITETIKQLDIDVFILDNFTTSFLSELQLQKQSWVLRQLRKMCSNLNIVCVLFFHTGKNVNTKRMDSDSIRGSATAVNLASYSYAMHQHMNDEGDIFNYLFVDKSRYHRKANKKYYKLLYENRLNVYYGDQDITKRDYENATRDTKDDIFTK